MLEVKERTTLCKIITDNHHCWCENCGELIVYETTYGIVQLEDVNYCWNCGAKFTGIKEEEQK